MIEVKIPFSGFYETIHSANLERLAEDQDGEWSEELNSQIDWKEKLKEYAEAYVKAYSKELGVPVVFKALDSPREYNFRTDRIFADMEESDLKELRKEVDEEEMREFVKDHFTSREGFSSFYSGDYEDWLKQEEPWDHNQWGAMLDVLAECADQNWEWELAEEALQATY